VTSTTISIATRVEAAVRSLPTAFSGPGGAVAVLKDGEVVGRHAWGWANVERRIPFSPKTLFRICSITKQFTCGLLLDAFPDPSVLDGDVRSRLPNLAGAAPAALHLAHNQSGLRDYWAVAMLQGAPAESVFGAREADRMIRETRSLHFESGTRYSYANQNFRLLGDIVQDRSSRGIAELLRARVFDRVGMETAFLAANTESMPDGTEGYEGAPDTGFRPAVNRILWTGDAGMGASLDDMIAWERHIDATRDDAGSLYHRLSAPVNFSDGAPAKYGFGLGRVTMLDRAVTAHGGGLRGWRSTRFYCPAERISVVVLFNHMAAAHEAAARVFAAALNEAPPPRDEGLPNPEWLGAYREPQTGLSVRIEAAPKGQVRLRYGYPPEPLDLQPDGSAGSDGARLRYVEGAVWMDQPRDNQSSRLEPLEPPGAADIAGRYRCDELETELTIEDAGGALSGAVSGFLGRGQMEQLTPVGRDVWVLPCPRALDHTAPGDWTLAFGRDAGGRITDVQVGCWLARGLNYRRIA